MPPGWQGPRRATGHRPCGTGKRHAGAFGEASGRSNTLASIRRRGWKSDGATHTHTPAPKLSACHAVPVAGGGASERGGLAVPFMGAGRDGGVWHIVPPAFACRINGIPGERLRARRNDQPRAHREMAGDPREVIGPKRNAAFRWATRSSPAMHKDRRALSRLCVRPVPIRQQHEVVKPV